MSKHQCPTCGRLNDIVNECRCDQNNLPTRVPERKLGPGDDLEMIKSPELWPYVCVLPMKNYKRVKPGEFPDTGIILASRPSTILVGTLGLTNWHKAERIHYASVEELLAAGWQVD